MHAQELPFADEKRDRKTSTIWRQVDAKEREAAVLLLAEMLARTVHPDALDAGGACARKMTDDSND